MRDRDIRPGIRRLVRLALRRGASARDELDDEIRLHLQLRAEQLQRDGLSPDDARREAERRFGSLDEARARLHHSAERREARMRWTETLHGIRHGLTVTLRGMRRSPGFVLTAVTCIALGVGANAAAFSVFEELVLRPLPVREPARLVRLGTPGPKLGTDNCNAAGPCDDVFSYPMFRDLQQAKGTGIASLAAHAQFMASIATGERAQQGMGVFVSGSYFPTLGIAPARGRLIAPADDDAPGAHPVAVVSHAFWSSQLGGDPTAVGRTIAVNGTTLTIVGVAPRGFEGTTLGTRPLVYVPITMASTVDPFFGTASKYRERLNYWAYVFGRLEPGVSIDEARAKLTAAYRPILRDVEAPLLQGVSDATRQRFMDKVPLVEDGRWGQSALRAETRTPLVLLFGITALVVLIACANIANLLLVRGAGRATEIAVRMSLGAGRRQLVAQLLAESVVLAALGGVASIVVAWVTLRAIGSFIPAAEVGFGADLSLALRPSVLLFAGLVSLGTGLVFGLFPALHGTRRDLIAAIRAGAGQVAGGHRAAARFRTALVTAQIAVSMALLACAGLFVRSLRNVATVDPGMATQEIVQFGLLPAFNGYSNTRGHALFMRLEDELAAQPGVTAVTVSGVPLFTGSSTGGDVWVEGYDASPDANRNIRQNMVGPGFFRAMGVPLLAGREFRGSEVVGTPNVAIVNEAFVRKFNLGTDVVGKRMRFGGRREDPLDTEIVGVARDAHYSSVKDDVPPMMYRPYRQDSTVSAAAVYVRTTLPTEQALRLPGRVVSRLDRNLPVVLLKPLPQQIRENVFMDRMVGTLSAGFAVLATLLAAVGLYGVLAYTVAQRTREIGVRMALGADAGRVRRLVMRQVALMAAVGGALGLAGAVALGRAAQSLLFRLDGRDPAVLAASATLLVLVALGAGWLPAVRASRLSPVRALKSD